MIRFDVTEVGKSFKDYETMYLRAKGSLKGSFKLDTYIKKLRNGQRIVLPNAVFEYIDKEDRKPELMGN
jgi:hypothetical protein